VDATGPEGLPRLKIFQVSLRHIRCLSALRRHAVSGSGAALYMMVIIIDILYDGHHVYCQAMNNVRRSG
jgi:hypothetical protein